MIYTECTICGCMPKPDEWSGQVIGVCYDWNYILVYLIEFAEDILASAG